MDNREQIKQRLIDLILNSNLPIDLVEEKWVIEYGMKEDTEVLAEIWIDVMNNLPELN